MVIDKPPGARGAPADAPNNHRRYRYHPATARLVKSIWTGHLPLGYLICHQSLAAKCAMRNSTNTTTWGTLGKPSCNTTVAPRRAKVSTQQRNTPFNCEGCPVLSVLCHCLADFRSSCLCCMQQGDLSSLSLFHLACTQPEGSSSTNTQKVKRNPNNYSPKVVGLGA